MTIKFRPLNETLGAEVIGVNVADDHSDEMIAEIRAGWLQPQYSALSKPRDLTMEQQKGIHATVWQVLTEQPHNPAPRMARPPRCCSCFQISKFDGEYIGSPPANVGEGWHSDHLLFERTGWRLFLLREGGA